MKTRLQIKLSQYAVSFVVGYSITLISPTASAQTQPAPQATSSTQAKGNYPHGVQIDLAAGYGSSAITNPDATTAYYNSLLLEGRGHIPLIGHSSSFFALDLIGSVQYIDLTNTATIGSQKEVANMIGPGGGAHVRFFKFIGGAQYHYMLARHYAVGPTSRELNYSMPVAKSYFGLQIPLGQLAVALTYSTSTGTVPKENSGLTSNSPYTDTVYWLTFTYSTGASLLSFLKLLF